MVATTGVLPATIAPVAGVTKRIANALPALAPVRLELNGEVPSALFT
jgi:hypothetical protein